MTIAPVSTASPLAPSAKQGAPAQSGLSLDKFDMADFQQHLLDSLDKDGDGEIAAGEWAAYRAGKMARGEYRPSGQPTTDDAPTSSARSIAEQAYQAAISTDDSTA